MTLTPDELEAAAKRWREYDRLGESGVSPPQAECLSELTDGGLTDLADAYVAILPAILAVREAKAAWDAAEKAWDEAPKGTPRDTLPSPSKGWSNYNRVVQDLIDTVCTEVEKI